MSNKKKKKSDAEEFVDLLFIDEKQLQEYREEELTLLTELVFNLLPGSDRAAIYQTLDYYSNSDEGITLNTVKALARELKRSQQYGSGGSGGQTQ